MYYSMYILNRYSKLMTVYFSAPKRFFKDVSVVSSGNNYELALDSRKLKTPLGNVFKVVCHAFV